MAHATISPSVSCTFLGNSCGSPAHPETWVRCAMKPGAQNEAGPPVDRERVSAQLQKWQERLLDLTRANPLLGINRSRVSRLRVQAPPLAQIYDHFFVDEAPFVLPYVQRAPGAGPDDQNAVGPAEGAHAGYVTTPGDLVFDVPPLELLHRLRRIYDNARTSVEERGVITLHLSLGALKWDDLALGDSLSPLVLIPCRLETQGPAAGLRLVRADEEPQVNPALDLYLRERYRISLPEIPEDLSGEALGPFFDSVRTAVAGRGWTVEDEVWLTTYSFEALAIYQDLKALAEAAADNAVVAALAGAAPLPEGIETVSEAALDAMPVPGEVPLPILGTDSTQLRALTLAASGRSLVVHGPPGTGKSQTIANLIAVALGQGKRVLFVSAKMAALNVVYDRLAARGLGEFCLEAHSAKSGKAKIIEELRHTLAAHQDLAAGAGSPDVEGLLRLREQLNEYVRELHRQRPPLGQSLFHALGRLEALRSTPDVRAVLPWERTLDVTRQQLQEAMDALRELQVQAELFEARGAHPWRGLALSDPPPSLEALEERLRALRVAASRLLDELSRVFGDAAGRLSPGQARRLAEALRAFAAQEGAPPGWAGRPADELAGAASLLTEASDRAAEMAGLRDRWKAVCDLPPDAALSTLEPVSGKFNSWARVLRADYWAWRRKARGALRAGAQSGHSALMGYYQVARALVVLERWFSDQEQRVRALGAWERREDAEHLKRAAAEYAAAADLKRAAQALGLDDNLIGLRQDAALRDMTARATATLDEPALAQALQETASRWPDGFCDGTAAADAPFPTLIDRCDELLASLPRYHEWMGLQRTLATCRRLGLSPFLEALKPPISARLASVAFEKRFYTRWAEAVIAASPALAAFSGSKREDLVARFRALDAQAHDAAAACVRAAASEPARLIASARSHLGYGSEVGILQRELEKRRRIKPLRKLFAEIPHAIQALKPCMLMSPVSVSTFLKPGGVSFDLVVFDEASQLPTQEAIPAILRSRQVVVAGDENQLPPSTYFDATFAIEGEEGEEDAGEELEPLESLLNDCVRIYPVLDRADLRWHYRSRDERLIRFSDHYFYEDRLVTFPSPTPLAEDRGVRLEFVEDGVWDRGKSRTNRTEARRVAEVVLRELKAHPERSMGVVAMNISQREAVEDALSEQLAGQPDLAAVLASHTAEPFFVKALENVQGDERDTIIISVGYARSPGGGFSFNFGPLNQEGGWRRLNVLVTRAKWQTVLVSSIRSRDLEGVNPNNRGAVALRDFIAYAEAECSLPPGPAAKAARAASDFEDGVAAALRSRGLTVDQQVGAGHYFIDMAVRDPRVANRYLLGIECDGARYHGASTARDRDLLREQVLRQLGWRIHRIWSTDWYRDRESVVRGVLAAAADALKSPPDGSPRAAGQAGAGTGSKQAAEAGQRPPAPAPPPPQPRADPKRRYTGGVPYRRFRPASPGGREVLLEAGMRAALAGRIAEAVRAEGPISYDLLLERLREVHGVTRTSAAIEANFAEALRAAERARAIQRVGGRFFQAPGTSLETFRVPGDGVLRPLSEIPPGELGLAVLHLVEDQMGVATDALPRAAAAVLGHKVVRGDFVAAVDHAVGDLVAAGRLAVRDGMAHLP